MTKQIPPSELPPFLYDKKGPWPQPSSIDPLGLAPEVVHLPKSIEAEFKKTVGRHYNKVLFFYWPIAIWKTLAGKYLQPVSDKEFSSWMGESAFSKFLVDITHEDNGIHKNDPHLRDKVSISWIRDKFKDHLQGEANKEDLNGNTYYIADFKLMEVVSPYEGMYVAPVILLMEGKPGREEKVAKAIYYYKDDFIVTPINDKTWDLSKYYVLMGANYRLTLSVHALLHFPMDSINAITQTALSTANPLFRLLYPHLQYSLGVNNAVLDSPESPVNNRPWLPYTLLTGPGTGIAELFVRGYLGDPNDPISYGKFLFNLIPAKIDSPYGHFLNTYYEVVKEFTLNACSLILKEASRDETVYSEIAYWARNIHAWYPDFPDEHAIFENDNLALATAFFIWDVSIAHTADHYNFSFQTTTEKAPFRIRQQPPHSPDSVTHVNRGKLNKFVDQFKYHYVKKMFFEPYVVSHLTDCEYTFNNTFLNDTLQVYVKKFKDELHRTDKSFDSYRDRGLQYIPLNKIASSIQF